MSADLIVEAPGAARALSEPASELADRLLDGVDFDHRLMGMKMAAMGGANPMSLYSLREAASFIHVDEYEATMQDRNASVGYIDPSMLSLWIDEVLGDAELAAAVRAEAGKGEFYGSIAMSIKDVLDRRLEQARHVVASRGDGAPDVGVEEDQE